MVSKNLHRFLLTAGLVAAVAAPLRAQDTTQAQPQAQRHVVQLGETLWGLAQLYLGDPFLWPEIYRLNTAVVEDPHWIFPGEELWLTAPDHTQVAMEPAEQQPTEAPPPVPPTDTVAVQQEAVQRPVEMVELPEAAPAAPPPVTETGPTIFARTPVTRQVALVQVGPKETYRGVRPGDFYRSGFLTEGEALPWGRVEGVADVGTVHGSARGVDAAMAVLYQDIRLQAPEGAIYQVGDSLLVVRMGRQVGDDWGTIVMPTGIVRVVSVNGRDAVGTIVEQYDQVRAGQSVLPVEPYPRNATGRPQQVTGGIEGLIIAREETNPIPNQYDVAYIDLGRNVGITPGDLFEIMATPELMADSPAGPQVLAEAKVVRVRDRSATVVLTRILTPGIRVAGRNAAGVPVRLVAKMPA